MAKDASITLRLDADLKARLDEAARSQHRTTSSLVNAILAAWSSGDTAPGAVASAAENGGNQPKFSRPPGRPRHDSTRAKELELMGPLLPWLRPLIGDEPRITVDEIIAKASKRPGFQPDPLLERSIANVLHGLGYTEWIEEIGTEAQRVWLR